ncbi:MAG: tetratricopeptide repeat protein [Vulcanimicrobiota bacterium]
MKNKLFGFINGSTEKIMVLILFLSVLTFSGAGCSSKTREANEHMKFGNQLAEEAKYEEAAQEFYKYIQLKPKDPEGYIVILQALKMSEREDEYYTILKKANTFFPDNERILLEQASFFISKGQYEKAREILNKVLEKSPDNLSGLTLKGILLTNENELDQAFDVFKKVIFSSESQKEENKAMVKIAYTYLLEFIGSQAKVNKASMDIILKAIKELPDYGRGYSVLGIYYYKNGELESAEKRFKIALQKDIDQEAFAYKMLGRIYEKQGRTEEAIANYEKFLEAYGKDGRDFISPEKISQIQVYSSIEPTFMNLKEVREKVKQLKGNK